MVKDKTAALECAKKAMGAAKGKKPSRGSSSRSGLPPGWIQGDWIRSSVWQEDLADLEESGLIRGHVTLLNQSMLGLKLTAYIGISMDRHTPDRFEAFEREVMTYPEVMECSVVTGQSSDYLLKAVVADMEYYEKFLLGRRTRIPGVTGVHSSFELRRVLLRTELPLDHIDDDTVLRE